MKKKLFALATASLAVCSLFAFARCDVIIANGPGEEDKIITGDTIQNPDGSITLPGGSTITPGPGSDHEGDIVIPLPDIPEPEPEPDLNDPEEDSTGLEYTRVEANRNHPEPYYYVSGIGTCTATNIVIASEFNNLPVKEIGTKAFYGCTQMVSVTIPDSITEIGLYSFQNCSNLTNVSIPESVTYIGNSFRTV